MENKDQLNMEIVFKVTESDLGGFSAHAIGHSIFTEGEDWQDLKTMIRDAVLCHFERADIPSIARLKYEREETITI
ncbi:MAG: 2-oxoisovalerate dehydrogenase [Gammaproteobacteria bacterium]|nr:2-oxoisovalerate dehydrogenase [Gammaproteobacteria bacterium]